MAVSKRFIVVGVLLAVFVGGIGVAFSKTSRGRINAAADILGASSSDRQNALSGNCGPISDTDLRLLCQGACGNISNTDVRYLCKGECGQISDPDIRSACQGG